MCCRKQGYEYMVYTYDGSVTVDVADDITEGNTIQGDNRLGHTFMRNGEVVGKFYGIKGYIRGKRVSNC